MESPPAEIDAFLSSLRERGIVEVPAIEPGGRKSGEWWLDFENLTVEWRSGFGFGLSPIGISAYGEGPAETFKNPERAAARAAQLLSPAKAPLPTSLRAVRELYGKTQEEMATLLNRQQAAISRLESRDDSKIETLKKYIEALGGRIEINAIFPDAQLPIYRSEERSDPFAELNLVVLKGVDPERLKAFYSKLGLRFVKHRHGTGAEHYASESSGRVFEIYPASSQAKSTKGLRIGFGVMDTKATISKLVKAGGEIISPPKDSPWGIRAVIKDPEGHKVEITQSVRV